MGVPTDGAISLELELQAALCSNTGAGDWTPVLGKRGTISTAPYL